MLQHLLFRAGILLALTLFVRPLAAQPIPYSFSASVQTYTPLEDAIVISPLVLNSINQVPVPLGFTFSSNNTPYTQIKVGYGGILITDDSDFLVLGYYTRAGFLLKPVTKVRYKTEGEAPNRIFKAEWFRMGFDGLPGEISFQIWLHESANAVQIHQGIQNVPTPSATFYNGISPLIGVLEDYDAFTGIAGMAQVVDGPADQPFSVIVPKSEYDPALPWGTDTLAPEGQVYTFGMVTTGINQVIKEALPLAVFPNPAATLIAFNFDDDDFGGERFIRISNIAGRTVIQQIITANSLDISALPPGAYVLNTRINGRLASGKFVKQ